MGLKLHLEKQLSHINLLLQDMLIKQALISQPNIPGEELEAVAVREKASCDLIEGLEVTRQKAQSALGYEMTADGAMKAAIDNKCEDVWRQILSQSERVKILGQSLIEQINKRSELNAKMLSILNGTKNSGLYGETGHARSNARAKNLGCA